MRKITLLIISAALFCLLPVLSAWGSEGVQKGSVNIDGIVSEETFLFKDGKVYVSLRAVADQTGISLRWDAKTSALFLTYPDLSSIRANTQADRIYEQDTFAPVDFLLSGGKSYICVQDLHCVARKDVFWDSENQVLYIYMHAYPAEGTSIISSLPYEGLNTQDNVICFFLEGLPQASWQMGGELADLRLIDSTVQSGMEEIQIAAFYRQPNGVISQLIITQRKLPNGDRMFFTRAYTPSGQQILTLNTQPADKVYGGSAFHFIDKGDLKEFLQEEPFSAVQRLNINGGTSVDQWHIFSQEDLTLSNSLVKRAWNASLDYHKSNGWVTPEGTYRSTPVEYLSQGQLSNQNVNLQASTPMLLLDTLNIEHSRLLEDFVHNAKFTLVEMQGEDGFWRAGINVAYLNRSYALGPNYIDTRMSVDASLFFVRYGLMFNDPDTINKGKHFKQYFPMLKDKGAAYNLQGGVLYPDYYSESQKSKTLVSLNHALYEMNYLYTLYNELRDHEARVLAEEMRLFINKSAQSWLAPNGDLYYALSPEGKYYAEDYVNITYIDLFVANSILEYMEVKDTAVESLLVKKGDYLDAIAAPQFESHLHVDKVLDTFDTQSSRKGDLFFMYPLEVKMAETGNQFYFACGTYHWIMGAENVTYLDKTYELDPMEKYVVVLNKWGLTLRSQGENSLPGSVER